MPRSKDVLVFYWVAVALSLTACLTAMPRRILWCISAIMAAHALVGSRTLPMLLASLCPWALRNGASSEDNAFLAMAYAFFFIAHEWDPLKPQAPLKPHVPLEPQVPLAPIQNPLRVHAQDV